MQGQPRPAEKVTKESRQRRYHFAELGEHQRLLLARRDNFGDFAEAGELAAVRRAPGAIVQPMRRMIADVLEPHQHWQHHAPAGYAFARLQCSLQLAHSLIVQCGLLPG